MSKGIDMNTDEVILSEFEKAFRKIVGHDTSMRLMPYLSKVELEALHAAGYQQGIKDNGLDRVEMISAIGRVDTLHAENERLKKILTDIKACLETRPVDCLGEATVADAAPWPIRNEMIHRIGHALKEAN